MCLHIRCLFSCSRMSLSCYPVYFFEHFWAIFCNDDWQMLWIECGWHQLWSRIKKNAISLWLQVKKPVLQEKKKKKAGSKPLGFMLSAYYSSCNWTNFHCVLIKVVLTSDLTCSSSSCCQLAVKFIALFYQMTWNNASNFSSAIYMWPNSTEVTHTEQRYAGFSWIFLTCKVYWKNICLTRSK